MTGQSRKWSIIEVVSSTLFGMGVSAVINAVVFPLYGWEMTASQNLSLVVIYTVVSVARGYAFRRTFERISRAK